MAIRTEARYTPDQSLKPHAAHAIGKDDKTIFVVEMPVEPFFHIPDPLAQNTLLRAKRINPCCPSRASREMRGPRLRRVDGVKKMHENEEEPCLVVGTIRDCVLYYCPKPSKRRENSDFR